MNKAPQRRRGSATPHKVLIFHGWLLRGTGSNVYNASLARALARLGHEVHLVCQEREAPDLGAGTPGSVTIHNPDIGGLLPVFVHDAYEGFEVKTFAELTDAELDRYLELNVSAVRDLVDALGGVDAALANHLIMGPVILARAGLRYAIKVHGSDLSYTILPELERWRPYAEQAVAGANGILVGSGHIAARLRLAVDDPQTNAKVRLGPPGVDTALFAPGGGGGGDAATTASSTWDRDELTAADALRWYAEAEGPRVIFVGKLLVSTGVDLLLAAWPLVHERHPDARLLVVGFGTLEAVLRGVVDGFASGDLEPLRELAGRGRGLEDGEDERLEMLSAFLDRLPEGYADAARAAAGSIRFAGRLEHDEVAAPLAGSDALIFPSTFPEAFGMVAAEAAAAGVLPVSAAHSGAAEVSRALAEELPPALRPLLSFELDDRAVDEIAARIDAWLSLDDGDREAARESLRATVERLWSWQGVARGVLAAASGDLDGLPRPGDA
ncbi:MAG: glycosyltransferase family 4 protein [Vicinamibacteria bacterium]